MDDLLQQGVIAHKAGKRDEARKIFITVVKQNPDSEPAWGWMYQASNNDQERIHCLKQILRINPKSEKANELLNQLLAPPLTSNMPFSSTPSPTPVSTLSQSKNANGLSITSLVLGIVAIPLSLCYGVGSFFGIAAMITGFIARNQVKEGNGIATAGIITGCISTLPVICIIIFNALVILDPILGNVFSKINSSLGTP